MSVGTLITQTQSYSPHRFLHHASHWSGSDPLAGTVWAFEQFEELREEVGTGAVD